MTEMSPLGTMNLQTKKMKELPDEERYELQTKQGYPLFGVEIKIVDDANNELARDGSAQGALLVRGPWIIESYFKLIHQQLMMRDGLILEMLQKSSQMAACR